MFEFFFTPRQACGLNFIRQRHSRIFAIGRSFDPRKHKNVPGRSSATNFERTITITVWPDTLSCSLYSTLRRISRTIKVRLLIAARAWAMSFLRQSFIEKTGPRGKWLTSSPALFVAAARQLLGVFLRHCDVLQRAYTHRHSDSIRPWGDQLSNYLCLDRKRLPVFLFG